MNSTVYIFGNLRNGYTQIPDDYTKEIFWGFYDKSVTSSQITTHRQDNLMYYGYIRKLDKGQYIGFSVLLNGEMFTNIAKLFLFFEKVVERLVLNGEILGLSNGGGIISHIKRLIDKQQDVDKIVSYIEIGIEGLQSDLCKLPSVSYGIGKDDCKFFLASKCYNDEVVDATAKFDTFIYKERCDTSLLTDHREQNKKKCGKKVSNSLRRQANEAKGIKKIIKGALGIF